jgi:hypothetical protein
MAKVSASIHSGRGAKDNDEAEVQPVDLIRVAAVSAHARIARELSPLCSRIGGRLEQPHLRIWTTAPAIEADPPAAVELVTADADQSLVSGRRYPQHLLAPSRAAGKPHRGNEASSSCRSRRGKPVRARAQARSPLKPRAAPRLGNGTQAPLGADAAGASARQEATWSITIASPGGERDVEGQVKGAAGLSDVGVAAVVESDDLDVAVV